MELGLKSVKGHSKPSEMTWFDQVHMTSANELLCWQLC